MSVTTRQAYARQYIDERHRLGFVPSAVDRALRHFAAYVDDLGLEGPLSIEIMATWARHPIQRHLLVPECRPRAHGPGQRTLSPNTVASYRDTMLLFLDFAQARLGKEPTTLTHICHVVAI
jgi:hypothetical protein